MPPHVNPHTGELLDAPYVEPGMEELRRELEEVRGDLARANMAKQDAIELLLKSERQVKQLKNELKQQLEEVPERQMMKALYDGWIRATGRNPKRCKLGPKREKAVLARIREGHSFERMMRAVTIGVKGATVSNKVAERLALVRVMKEAIELLTPEQGEQLRETYKATLKEVGGSKLTIYDDLEFVMRDEVHLERFADMADAIEPLDPEKSIDASESEV